MDKIDIAIIGAGVVGLAVASEIAKSDKEVFIFERNNLFGQETSSRSSEVIHSGIYYPAESLKAKTCIKGNRLLYAICQRGGIPYKKIGKLIIACSLKDAGCIENLYSQGQKNGLEGMRLIDKSEIKRLEPNIKADCAIYLASSGIIDSHALMEYFLAKAKAQGADVIYGTEIIGIEPMKKGFQITAKDKGATYTFTSECVINCAGLESDVIAAKAGIKNNKYTLSYCKGDYFRLAYKKDHFVNHLVYPACETDANSLGIHATPDLAGSIRIGPDAEYLTSRKIDYTVNPLKKNIFLQNAKTFLPLLEDDDMMIDTSGIRPKLQGPGDGFRDFIIKHEADSGLEGFIDLVGIESPGLTASPAIAEMVKEMVLGLV